MAVVRLHFTLTSRKKQLVTTIRFKRRRVNSAWHGTKSVSYLDPKIFGLVPSEIKESESFNAFKFKIKRWVPEGCPCRTCKIYLDFLLLILSLSFSYFHPHLCSNIYYFTKSTKTTWENLIVVSWQLFSLQIWTILITFYLIFWDIIIWKIKILINRVKTIYCGK